VGGGAEGRTFIAGVCRITDECQEASDCLVASEPENRGGRNFIDVVDDPLSCVLISSRLIFG
jgi:hypothetical protein